MSNQLLLCYIATKTCDESEMRVRKHVDGGNTATVVNFVKSEFCKATQATAAMFVSAAS